MTGGLIMAEFMVAIDQLTYDAGEAEDKVTAIDLALEGQGLELSSETRDAYVSEYQIEPLDPTPDLRADRLAERDARRPMR
jgi:hypothetical protein